MIAEMNEKHNDSSVHVGEAAVCGGAPRVPVYHKTPDGSKNHQSKMGQKKRSPRYGANARGTRGGGIISPPERSEITLSSYHMATTAMHKNKAARRSTYYCCSASGHTNGETARSKISSIPTTVFPSVRPLKFPLLTSRDVERRRPKTGCGFDVVVDVTEDKHTGRNKTKQNRLNTYTYPFQPPQRAQRRRTFPTCSVGLDAAVVDGRWWYPSGWSFSPPPVCCDSLLVPPPALLPRPATDAVLFPCFPPPPAGAEAAAVGLASTATMLTFLREGSRTLWVVLSVRHVRGGGWLIHLSLLPSRTLSLRVFMRSKQRWAKAFI